MTITYLKWLKKIAGIIQTTQQQQQQQQQFIGIPIYRWYYLK